MEDKIKDLFGVLQQSKEFSAMFKDERELGSVLSTEQGVNDFYEALNLSDEFKGMFKDANEFSDTFQLKKKVSSEVPPSGETPLPTVGQELEKPTTPPLPSESAKEKPKDRETTVIGDMLRSLKSSSLRALGGMAETPMLINRTVQSFTTKPLVKLMGGTEEEANQMVDYLSSTNTFGQSMALGEEAQKSLNKTAQKTEDKIHAIEGTIWDNISKGNLAEAGELLGRGVVQSLPYLAMTASTAGGGTVAVLGTIGATSAAQQYGETEGKGESRRQLNAWLYGGWEAAGELVTAGLLRGVGKAFRQGLTKEVSKETIGGMAKGVAKGFGMEGSSEAVTQIGQNITDIITGVNPNIHVLDNVLDAGLIGGFAGVGIGGANIGASVLGRSLASDKEVTQVQDNTNQQKVLIDQIESTDSDPVKTALESRLKTLKYEADKTMDKNYELAKELSTEQRVKVAELYSVWNELQDKIDSGKITAQELPTIENTIEGIKAEIESIKEAKIAELGEVKGEGVQYKIGEETFENKEAVGKWLKKNYSKDMPQIWNKATEQLVESWVKKNKETIDKKEAKELETKLEEETKDAERIRKEAESTGEQPQGVEQGEEGGLRLRDDAQDRVETVTGEEVTPPIAIGEKTSTTKAENKTLGIKTANAFTIPITKEGTDVGSATIENVPEGWRIKWIDVEGTRTDKTSRGAGREAMRLLNAEAQKEGKVLISDLGDKNSADMVKAWDKLVESGEAEKLEDGSWRMKPQDTIAPKADITEISPEETIETPSKAEQLKTKEQELKNSLANDLEGLMGAIGGIKEFNGEQRQNVIRYLTNIATNLAKLTGLKGQQLWEKVKEYLKDNKVVIPDDVLEETKGMYEGRGTTKTDYVNVEDQKSIIQKFTHYKSGDNYYPRTIWADWFLGRDRKAKERIAKEINDNPELKNALISSLYDEYVKLTGKSDLSYEDFLNQEISIYRGETDGDVKGGEPYGFQTYTLTENEANNFTETGRIIEKKIKPKDTLGLIQSVGAEREILVPTKFSDKFYEKEFNDLADKNMSVIEGLSKEQSDKLFNLVDDNKYKEAHEELSRLIKPTPTGDISPIQPSKGESDIGVPPKGNVPISETGETKVRKTQINSLIQDQTLQQREVAKIVDANKEEYTVTHGEDAIADAKKMIDEMGVANATANLIEPTKKMADFPVRTVGRQVLLDFYSRAITDPNANEVDKTIAFNNIDRLQEIIAREATNAGAGISLLKIWKSIQPTGLLEYVRRKIDQGNQKILDKKVGDTTVGQEILDLYNALTSDSKKIVDDILAGKLDAMPKEAPRPPKDIPKRKTVPKERIKKEQDYRKKLIEDYKKSHAGTMSLAVTGLTSDQIEIGGNMMASYVREGIYRLQDFINELKKDYKALGVDLNDQQVDEFLAKQKDGKETFKEYLDRKESQARVRAGEKLISKKISDVITEHWTEKDELKRTLAQKLVDEAGLTEEEAKRLEKEILEKFDKEILRRSQEKLTKILGTEKIPKDKTKKGVIDKMIDLINLGALDEDLYRDLFSDKFKLIKLTDQHKEEILRFATNVQLSSNKGWLERDATIKLAKYIYELYPLSRTSDLMDTWISMAYSNMLFGPSTSILNLWSAGWNMGIRPIRDLTNLSKWLKLTKGIKISKKGIDAGDIYNPFGEMIYVPMLRGINLGWNEAKEVYKNGDLNNKYIEEVAKKGQFKVTPLERNKYGKALRFKPITVNIKGKTYNIGNLFNLYKYAGRNLAAQDKLMLTTSYEVEVAHILRDKLKNKNLTGRALTREVMSILRGDKIDMDKLNATLDEDVALYKRLNGEDMTELQKKIRKRELMFEQMPLNKEDKAEAEQLARSNIFTDDRGGMFGTTAQGLGWLANNSQVSALIVKPFVLFTKVVGNVAEYMMDHTPYYGFMRANGLGLVSMVKHRIDPELLTAQMGQRGSRLYYEQMGRAWMGTMAFNLAMLLLLGNDEDDFVEISGGYQKEGFKKRGRENVLPPYTLRIGKVLIPYKNIPGLAIPFALVGNLNDGLKNKRDEGDLQDRLTAALLLDAVSNSVFMVKDMSFLEGVQRGTQIMADAMSGDEKKWAKIGEGLIKSYVGFATRPLPQNNNAVQQIFKIFDPTSYSQSEIKGMLAYAAGIQHFVGLPVIDQLGDTVKSYPGETLLPYTHWLNIKGDDKRWSFLAKHNAIPAKLYNRTMQIEGEQGIETRQLEEKELYDYTLRTGYLFSESLNKYMSDEAKATKRGDEIITRKKANGDIEKVSGVREDIEKLWSDAKDKAEIELFRWGSVKEDMPQEWELIKKQEAYQSYQQLKETGDYKWSDSELYELNNLATLRYAEKVKKYLSNNKKVEMDKKKEVEVDKKKISKFKEEIDKKWKDALDDEADKIEKRIKKRLKNK